ncbi:hypothetical protein P4234_12420 [Pseudomonas aeruginosa]|nr:hypothetical protein [Pseudomonas aeruginosa]
MSGALAAGRRNVGDLGLDHAGNRRQQQIAPEQQAGEDRQHGGELDQAGRIDTGMAGMAGSPGVWATGATNGAPAPA